MDIAHNRWMLGTIVLILCIFTVYALREVISTYTVKDFDEEFVFGRAVTALILGFFWLVVSVWFFVEAL